jgi:hypothetical protein
MYNPFTRFQPRFIQTFRNVKKRYLVSQTFKRENNLFKDENKNYLLLTHYDDNGLAKIHFNAVSFDKYAAILDLEKDQHREKLTGMLKPDSPYIIYSSLITDPNEVKKSMNKILSISAKFRLKFRIYMF